MAHLSEANFLCPCRAYDARLNPFAAFQQSELEAKLARIGPWDRAMLSFCRRVRFKSCLCDAMHADLCRQAAGKVHTRTRAHARTHAQCATTVRCSCIHAARAPPFVQLCVLITAWLRCRVLMASRIARLCAVGYATLLHVFIACLLYASLLEGQGSYIPLQQQTEPGIA